MNGNGHHTHTHADPSLMGDGSACFWRNTPSSSRGRCRQTSVDGFRVYVPDATRSQFVEHRTTGCANAAVHLIGHRPYR